MMTRWLRTNGARRYEPEVHLGVLAIIVILLLINLLSNWSLQHFRVQVESDALSSLREISLVLSRQLEPEELIVQPSSNWQTETPIVVRAAILSRLAPAAITSEHARELAHTLRQQAAGFGDESVIAEKIKALNSGEMVQVDPRLMLYFNAASRPGEKGGVLILAGIPVLAEMNQWTQRIKYASIIGLILILVIYVLLMRRITQPIRQLANQAAQAGRQLDQSIDPATAIVQDYQQLVNELQDRERKLREANLALSEEAYRLSQIQAYALGSMSRGMIVIDESDQIIAVNPSAQKLFADAQVQLEVGDLLEKVTELMPALASATEIVRLQSTPQNTRCNVNSTAGERIIEIVTTTVSDHDGKRVGVGFLLSDLTESLAVAQEQSRRERLSSLGEMAAGLAHQLRNSLGAMRGFASLVKRRAPVDVHSHLNQLLTESAEAEELISRFLSLSRPLEQHVSQVDVRAMGEETVHGFSQRAEQQSVTITFVVKKVVTILADPLLLKQALSNLIDNALHHTPGGGTITVTLGTTQHEREALLVVSDTGSGMSESQRARLFTPFFSTRANGTGLGLSFVRKVVELHHGDLRIESRSGQGTTASMILPISLDQSQASENAGNGEGDSRQLVSR